MMLHEAIYELLMTVSSGMEHHIPLAFAFQNAPRPNKPYGSIRFDTTKLPHHEVYLPVQETGWQVVGGWRRATVELQVYGRGAGGMARRFALGLQFNSIQEKCQGLNVSVGSRLFLSEVPELLNGSQYEERGIYQFELFYSDELEDNVGLIETVEVSWQDDETLWDDENTVWDNDATTWDNVAYCKQVIHGHPPNTPIHPE